jgi:hypothetical protein
MDACAAEPPNLSNAGFAARAGLSPRPSQTLLAALCLLLAAGILYEVLAPLPEIERLPLTSRPVPTSPLPVWVAPSRQTFSAINERFVLDPQRRSVHPSNTANDAPGPSPVLALVGVIIAGQTRLAIVRDGNEASAASVAVGGTIDGWQIAQIDSNRIVIRSGATDRTILLEANRGAPAISVGLQASPPPTQVASVNVLAARDAAVRECRRAIVATGGAAGIAPAQCEEIVDRENAKPLRPEER